MVDENNGISDLDVQKVIADNAANTEKSDAELLDVQESLKVTPTQNTIDKANQPQNSNNIERCDPSLLTHVHPEFTSVEAYLASMSAYGGPKAAVDNVPKTAAQPSASDVASGNKKKFPWLIVAIIGFVVIALAVLLMRRAPAK